MEAQGQKNQAPYGPPLPPLLLRLLLILSGPILTIAATPAAHLLLIPSIVLPSGLNCLTNLSKPTQDFARSRVLFSGKDKYSSRLLVQEKAKYYSLFF